MQPASAGSGHSPEPGSAGPPSHAAPDPRVGAFALWRIASLPIDHVARLAPPRTAILVDRLLSLKHQLDGLSRRLETVLYELVPQLSARHLRRTALRISRDIHNHRWPSVEPAQLTELLGKMHDTGRALLTDWLGCKSRESSLLDEAEATLQQELRQHMRPNFSHAVNDVDFSPALALASPDLSRSAQTMDHQAIGSITSTKFERSVLLYLIRASAKTSPFSSFMYSAPLDLSTDARRAHRASAVRLKKLSLNRGVLVRLYQRSANLAAARDDIRLCVNTTIRDGGEGRVTAIVSQYTTLLGRPWRQDRLARFRIRARLLSVLAECAPRVRWSQLTERLRNIGLSRADADSLIRRLLDRGLLWLPPLTDGLDDSPVEKLHEPPVPLMREIVAQIAEDGGHRRATLVKELWRLEKDALTRLGDEPSNAYRNVVLEDAWMCDVDRWPAGQLQSLAGELRAFLSSQMALRSEYMQAREVFVEKYGVGGECRDLLAFIMQSADALMPSPDFGSVSPRIDVKSPGTVCRDAKLGVTAYLQLIPDQATEEPESAVINRVFEGLGWLTARFARGDHPNQRRLRKQLQEWLRNSLAPCEPVDLMIGGECNDLQVHPRLTERICAWPCEPFLPRRMGLVNLSEISVRHNPKTDLLEFADARNKPIRPVYLGSVLPSPTWGLQYVMTVLIQPFCLKRPTLMNAPPDRAADVESRARHTEGRLVLTRAMWWVRTAYLKSRWYGKVGARRLADVAGECGVYGIPRRFYAKPYFPCRGSIRHDRLDQSKPLWVDRANPWCLDVLERVIADAEWVLLTEALPDVGELWIDSNGERRVTEFQLELLVTAG